MRKIVEGLTKSQGLRQLIKFCLVGVSSLTVDLLAFNLLLTFFSTIFALSVAFIAGVSNSFIWNSRWTFKGTQRNLKKQVPLFFATNLVGFLLNALVTTGVLVIAAHYHFTRTHFTPEETLQKVLYRTTNGPGFSRLALNAAKMCAAVVVMAWNFSASKFITFRHVPVEPSTRVGAS